EAPDALIHDLADRGVSVVLAWPGPQGRLPDLAPALAAADHEGLPLVQLAARATFRETTQLAATKVPAQLLHVLASRNRAHRMLGDVFARGAGLPALARAMAQISGTTVLVVGNSGDLLAHAASSSPANTRQHSDLAAALAQLLHAEWQHHHDPDSDGSPRVL